MAGYIIQKDVPSHEQSPIQVVTWPTFYGIILYSVFTLFSS